MIITRNIPGSTVASTFTYFFYKIRVIKSVKVWHRRNIGGGTITVEVKNLSTRNDVIKSGIATANNFYFVFRSANTQASQYFEFIPDGLIFTDNLIIQTFQTMSLSMNVTVEFSDF